MEDPYMYILSFFHLVFLDLGIGDFIWVPFNISVPISSTVPMELAVISETTMNSQNKT